MSHELGLNILQQYMLIVCWQRVYGCVVTSSLLT